MGLGDTIAGDVQTGLDDPGDDATPRISLVARARQTLRTAVRSTLDVVLPPLCLNCQTRITAHDALCPACWRGITFIRPPLCDRLGLPLPFDTGAPMISAAAEADPQNYERARAVALFGGLMRDLIHDFKYRDAHDCRRLFGRWLSEAGGELIASADIIVPVPLARMRLLTRRFNQAQILAGELARRSGKPVEPFALRRTRPTAHQTGLTRAERRRNVRGAFVVPERALPRIAGKNILLIDDVITTGATASAAARALKKAGAARIDVLALALVADGNR